MGLFSKSKEKIHQNALNAFDKKDYQKSFNLFKEAADMGHAEAYFALGQFYEKGISVKKDPDQALALYDKAVSLGCDKASKRSAPIRAERLLTKGVEVFHEQKYEEAFSLFSKAEELWSTQASATDLAVCYEVLGKRDLAKQWYIEAYNRGDLNSVRCLVRMSEGESDYIEWLRILANNGNEEDREAVIQKYMNNLDEWFVSVENQLLAAVEEHAKSLLKRKNEVYILGLVTTEEEIKIGTDTFMNLFDIFMDSKLDSDYDDDDYTCYMYDTRSWAECIEPKEVNDFIYRDEQRKVRAYFIDSVARTICWQICVKLLEVSTKVMKRFKETDTYKEFPKLFLYVDHSELLGEFDEYAADSTLEELNGPGSYDEYESLFLTNPKECQREFLERYYNEK